MKKSFSTLILSVTLIIGLMVSCSELKEYFHDPESESITDVIKTAAVIGFSASAAISVMEGNNLPNVRLKTVCSGFPCVSVMVIRIDDNAPFPFWSDNTGEIIVAGMWADDNTAILTLIMTDFNARTKTFRLKNIHTIPVIKSFDGNIMAVFASMDVNFNENSKNLMEINILTGEIESEILRIPTDITDDLYVAVEQDAWIIEINQRNTPANLYDDVYTITGGGQLVELKEKDTEIIQQALVDVRLEQSCKENPVEGFGLMRKVNTSDNKFPELGTVILGFNNSCNGMAEVMLATGVYIGSNGKNISLDMN